MRRFVAASALCVVASLLAGCVDSEDGRSEPAESATVAAPSGASDPPPIDSRRVSIYSAVIHDVIEYRSGPVFVWTQLCEHADEATAHYGSCPETLTTPEQDAIVALLAEDVPNLSFVAETETVAQDMLDGAGAELVRLGPIEELHEVVEGDTRFVRIQVPAMHIFRIQVPAMHICGGLCGGGSVWEVEQTNDGWEVIGPASGYGEWIA